MRFLASLSLAMLLLLTGLGCGSGRHPVVGRVVYQDGDPVPGGTVIAEATIEGKPVSVQGAIERDGTFRLGTERPGDGALPGVYRILIMPVALGDSELAEGKVSSVDGKYGKFETSGLTCEVKSEKKELTLTITRPKARAKGK